MESVTQQPLDLGGPTRTMTDHIAGQRHAMAGATIALSAALACSLGEACLGIAGTEWEDAEEQAKLAWAAGRLRVIRGALLALADEDGAAITAFAQVRDAGESPRGQERLCQMPVEMGRLAVDAALILQEHRPLVRRAQDDLEMALALLHGATRASILLLDSNLRIWPEAALLARFEPELADLRGLIARITPVERVRA
jgi:formiminotetrahydrofolate cyclodeaminase